KRFFSSFAAVLAISSAAFAQVPTLPDYQKDGKPDEAYVCDNGQTTARYYLHDDWSILEVNTASGDVLVDMVGRGGMGFFVKQTGADKMPAVSHEEWDTALLEKAPAVYHALHGTGPSDCAPKK
ncbi:MAG: hypothetical protein HYW88_02525, partial [Candidatus Sungbacteria bacterium]|nr:hypothetical protein [Candidatus Sungbacteria bacterium]